MYSSNTGNTKIIAEAIKEELSNEDIVYFGKTENNIEADIYIVGSWTDKGNCSSEIKEFLTKLNYKKIAYFGTAGFGGQVEYYQTLFNRVKENINDIGGLLKLKNWLIKKSKVFKNLDKAFKSFFNKL